MTYRKPPKKPTTQAKDKMTEKMGSIASQLGGIPGRNGMSNSNYPTKKKGKK